MNPPRANTVGVHRWRPTLNKQKKLRKQMGSLAGRPQWVPRPTAIPPSPPHFLFKHPSRVEEERFPEHGRWLKGALVTGTGGRER